jgi:outer membrane protein TolC
MKCTARLLLCLSFFMAVFPGTAASQDLSDSVCRVVIYDKKTELEDARIAVDLARSRFEAYEKIFKMIEGLWEAKTIPRMDYIKAKYDQDAARLELERYGFILARQAALVEQYRLICGGKDFEKEARKNAIRAAYLHYRRSDCDALAKGIEVASTNLEFNREYLENILNLRKENYATNTDVIMAKLDVELEEKRLADAKQRTTVCHAELEQIEKNPSSPLPSD